MSRSEKSRAFRIDLRMKGVGRLRISAGTTQRREYHRRVAVVRDLYRDGRLDVLCALRDGTVALVEVLGAVRESGAHSLTAITLVRPLWAAITATLPEMGKSRETRNRYRLSLETLQRCGVVPANARVRDLDRVVWRDVRPHFGGAADWNHLRRALSAFLSTYLGGQSHPYRRTVITRIDPEREVARTPDVSVPTFWRVVDRLPLWAKDPVHALALVGLRMGEYIHADATSLRHDVRELVVVGKSGVRTLAVADTAWPIVCAAIPARYAPPPREGERNTSSLRYQRLAKALRTAAMAEGVTLTLHDLRHLSMQLASDAGHSDGAIADQHGHADARTTRRYTARRTRRDVADATAARLSRTGT